MGHGNDLILFVECAMVITGNVEWCWELVLSVK